MCLDGIDASTIVKTLIEQVKAHVSSISNVRLVAQGGIEPFVRAISPQEGYGPLTADQEHVLSFDVSFTGMRSSEDSPQVLTGSLDVVADSVVVGRQNVKVTVPPAMPGHIEFQVSPAMNELTLIGQQMARAQVQITVTKPAAPRQADIYLLADTTESMRPILAAVQEDVTRLLGELEGLPADMHFGVGNYKDFPAAQPSEVFEPQQSLTDWTARPDDPVTAAITSWKAAGGGDTPEGQLYALDQLAEPPGGSIDWRPQAKRLVVWVGDAPGHDPVSQAMSGLSYDITEASVTKKLVDEQISVLAISMTSEHGPKDGLDANPIEGLDIQGKGYWAVDYGEECTAGGGAGQATRIAQATGGVRLDSVNASAIVKTISDQVKAQVGNVRLVARGGIEPFVRAISPKKGYGPLTADQEHVLSFDVYFAGVRSPEASPQVLTGSLDVVADDVVVGGQNVTILVPRGL